jgi:uncharacterized protein (TIGR02145 family)
MKKLLLILLIAPVLGFGQGEQRYADGTATDQDGNTFEWINYGDLDWAIENAKVETYRDGTIIPQKQDQNDWNSTGAGAWCYHNETNDIKFYNWWAIKGVDDNDDATPNKEFAPEGWRVPSHEDWINLENYLIANGYNFDGTTTGNKIAKSMASTSQWILDSRADGIPGNNPTTNNLSGFNTFPNGTRHNYGYVQRYYRAYFWTTDIWPSNETYPYSRDISFASDNLQTKYNYFKLYGCSVRFVRDASTASVEKHAKAITVYPNPTSSTIEVQQEFSVAKVYDLSGKELLKSNSKTIDLSELSSSVYLLRLYDNSNKVLGTTKVVKQ